MPEVSLKRTTKSLRHEAAEKLLWMLENGIAMTYSMDSERLRVWMGGDNKNKANNVRFDVGRMDERERYETIINLWNEASQ